MKAGLSAVALAVVMGAGLAAPALANPEYNLKAVRREGSGEARLKRDALELKAFPVDALAGLTDWAGGEALTADSMKGKVVLLMTWSAWQPPSQQALARAAALAAQHAEKGLLVVAVHPEQRFDAAGKHLADNGLKVLMAKDAGGKFRAALQADADPDVYLVDRAGNLRLAGIMSDQMSRAAELLLRESAEEAAAQPTEVAQRIKADRAADERTKDVGLAAKAGQALKVSFTPPEGAAYERALWPRKNSDEEVQQHANNIQGSKLEVDMSQIAWLGEKPDLASGKIVLIDFWATWCAPCKASMPTINEIARRHHKDLIVVGVSGNNEDRLTVERFLRGKQLQYFHAFDTKEVVGKALSVRALPTMLLLSTDGVVRWIGHPADPNFQRIIETLINVDPGIKARREAEDRALKAAS